MLYSDWLKIRTQNQVNILPSKRIYGGGGGGEDVNLVCLFLLQLERGPGFELTEKKTGADDLVLIHRLTTMN